MAIRKVEIRAISGEYSKDVPYPCLRINSDGSLSGFDTDFFCVTSDSLTHTGLVVDRHVETNVRIMSDVWADNYYAVVWNPEKQVAERVFLGNNEFNGHFSNWESVVDAPEEIMDLYQAWTAGHNQGKCLRDRMNEYDRVQQRHQDELHTPRKGKIVKVVRGRKVPLGTTGRVFWVGTDNWGEKLGVATSERRNPRGGWMDVVWVRPTNVEVVSQN